MGVQYTCTWVNSGLVYLTVEQDKIFIDGFRQRCHSKVHVKLTVQSVTLSVTTALLYQVYMRSLEHNHIKVGIKMITLNVFLPSSYYFSLTLWLHRVVLKLKVFCATCWKDLCSKTGNWKAKISNLVWSGLVIAFGECEPSFMGACVCAYPWDTAYNGVIQYDYYTLHAIDTLTRIETYIHQYWKICLIALCQYLFKLYFFWHPCSLPEVKCLHSTLFT